MQASAPGGVNPAGRAAAARRPGLRRRPGPAHAAHAVVSSQAAASLGLTPYLCQLVPIQLSAAPRAPGMSGPGRRQGTSHALVGYNPTVRDCGQSIPTDPHPQTCGTAGRDGAGEVGGVSWAGPPLGHRPTAVPCDHAEQVVGAAIAFNLLHCRNVSAQDVSHRHESAFASGPHCPAHR